MPFVRFDMLQGRSAEKIGGLGSGELGIVPFCK